MTQLLSADVQRLPTLSGPGSFRPSLRPNAPVRRPTHPSRPSSQVVDLTDDSGSEPHPAKRRRVEDKQSPIDTTDENGSSIGQGSFRSARASYGRPPLSFAAQLNEAEQSTVIGSDGGKAGTGSKLPPLPTRPWKHKATQPDAAPSNGIPPLRDYGKVESTPFRIEAPAQAPLYREDRVADFFPWVGKHPEDVMNEQTAKQGYYDRQITQNETGTARPSLYSIFKHKGGLETLSSIFSRAVEQRQACGTIDAASNFKPPPRVTLTEAKRKAWLSDLADSNVPLRKLSRTIPQGIRGQQLLEQSLANSVPVGRAVWFAKCVGANEIRTLKRKGTSGTSVAGAELKWLKEWTGGVQSFLGGILRDCGKEDWKQKMSYAFNIVIRFYTENMLDKDYFISWLISSLMKSDLDSLPLWLLLSRSFIDDILKLRRHGKIFAEALLRHLKDAKSQDTEDYVSLISNLSQSVRLVISARPLLFVLPQNWDEYEETFKSCSIDEPRMSGAILAIIAQNHQLSVIKGTKLIVKSSRQQLIQILDLARAPFDILQISQNCLQACEDRYLLVRTVLEWSATPFRVGHVRKYLTIHLLRHWHNKGIDIDQPVRDVVVGDCETSTLDMDAFYNVTADLVRSHTISISRCLQLALAVGLTKAGATDGTQSERGIRILRLIEEAPISNMPAHVKNLRNTVLTRAGYNVESEADQVSARKALLQKRLPLVTGVTQDDEDMEMDTDQASQMSRCTKIEVSRWIHELVANHHKDRIEVTKQPSSTSSLTTDDLQILRGELAFLEDLPILADVLRHCCNSDDVMVLATVAETLNAHFEEFSAIGALEPLCSMLCETYARLRSTPVSLRHLTIALINITAKFPDPPIKPVLLLEDMARGDRSVAIAACSPISDYMAESLQQAGSSFADEFDQLLSTGNIMDDQAMTRLFYTVTERIESSAGTNREDALVLCHMVLRLMGFRPKQFEQLMQVWLKRLLSSSKSTCVDTVELLIGSGVTTTDRVVLASKEYILPTTSTNASQEAQTVRTSLVSLFRRTYQPQSAQDAVAHRAWYSREQCLVNTSTDIVQILAVLRAETISNSAKQYGKDAWEFKHAVQQMIVTEFEARDYTTEYNIVSRLLGFLTLGDISDPDKVATLIRSNDIFSLRLRTLLLKSIYSRLPASRDGGSFCQEDVIGLLFESAIQASDEEGCWMEIVTMLGNDAAQRIRQQAEEAFYALPGPHSTASTREITTSYESFVNVIERTAFTIPESGVSSSASSITERIHGVFRFVSMQSNVPISDDMEPPEIWSDSLRAYFVQLLRLAAVHRSSYVPPPTVTATNQAQCQQQIRILLLLTTLALHPSIQHASTAREISLQTQTLNIAAHLSDNLPEESRLVLLKNLKDRARDPRAKFLFSALNTESSTTNPHGDLIISRDGEQGKEATSTEYKVKSWELVQGIHSGGSSVNDTSMSLSLFQGRVITGKNY